MCLYKEINEPVHVICVHIAEINSEGSHVAVYIYMYSKTCLKPKLKDRQNKDLTEKW